MLSAVIVPNACKAGGLAFQGDITPPVSLEIEACLTSRDHAASTVNCAFSAMLNAVEAAPTAAMAGASRASAPRHSLDVLPRSAAQIRPWGPLQVYMLHQMAWSDWEYDEITERGFRAAT